MEVLEYITFGMICFALLLVLFVLFRLMWIDRQFLSKKAHKNPEEAPWCGNCRYTNKGFEDEPCCYCDKWSEWVRRS